MKKLFWILIAVFVIGGGALTTAEAQGHRNDRKHATRGHHPGQHKQGRKDHYKKRPNRGDRFQKHEVYRHDRRQPGYHRDRRPVSYRDRRYDRTHVDHYRHPQYRRVKHYRPPHWAHTHHYQAKHPVYFRDYHMFYDPYRDGYVYYHNHRWLFSPTIPTFVANVDLGRAHIQIMSDIPVRARPELYYERYARRYPAQISINIPLPPLPGF